MRRFKSLVIAFLAFVTMSHAQTVSNPFLKPFDTVHGTPPFSQITNNGIEEAIDSGIEKAWAEVEAIANNPEPPTFDNTIVALERAGSDLNRVLGVAYPLMEAASNDELMEIAVRVSPKLSEYSTKITMLEPLWERVKAVYNKKDQLNLDKEDQMLLQNTYDSFALAGADLKGDSRERYKEIKSELSKLTTLFGQNVLKELNTYEIELEAADLDGLPENIIAEAAEIAKEKGKEGKYIFTLAQPTYVAFLQNSTRGDLREKMWRLYQGRNQQGEFDNLENIKKIVALRLEMAKILGHDTYASHSQQKTMAGGPDAVYNLLDNLREAYRPAQLAEMIRLTEFASETEGKPVEIMPWDYSYYSKKLKIRDYDYDSEEMRPYFSLDNVIEGVFGLAGKLYGIKFVENPEIEVYHPDVKGWDVVDADGSFLGVLYTDFFPRESKRPGAWMTNFREQRITAEGVDERPQVSIVMNFTKPVAGKPSLLSPGEVETFLHEFGHALHGLLAKGKYASTSGTNVYRDFVELPSQFNENYLYEKEFLDGFAKHYETGEPIPAELVEKMKAASQYGAAYACMRQLMFGYLDMAWHTITDTVSDPVEFERKAIESVAIFPDIEGSMTSPQFNHIFSGGYAAGYYSYKWAEVLDADAFEAFKENGLFDKETAKSFRENILEKGGSENPAVLYRRFRGKEPSIDALLKRDGIKTAKINQTM